MTIKDGISLLTNLKDKLLIKVVLSISSIFAAFSAIGYLSSLNLYSSFINERIVPLVFILTCVLNLVIYRKDNFGKKWISNIKKTFLAAFLIASVYYLVTSFMGMINGAIPETNERMSVLDKKTVFRKRDNSQHEKESISEKIINDHVRPYKDLPISNDFVDTVTVAFVPDENDEVNSVIIRDSTTLLKELSLLPILKAEQVFSMNEKTIGLWKSIKVMELNSNRKLNFWQKIKRGARVTGLFFKNIFRKKKRKKKKVDRKNVNTVMLKKNALNFQYTVLGNAIKKNKNKLSKRDQELFNQLDTLNSNLNNYYGGLSFYTKKLNVLSLGATVIHNTLFNQSNTGTKGVEQGNQDSIDSLFQAIVESSIGLDTSLIVAIKNKKELASINKSSSSKTKSSSKNNSKSVTKSNSTSVKPVLSENIKPRIADKEPISKATTEGNKDTDPTLVVEADLIKGGKNSEGIKVHQGEPNVMPSSITVEEKSHTSVSEPGIEESSELDEEEEQSDWIDGDEKSEWTNGDDDISLDESTVRNRRTKKGETIYRQLLKAILKKKWKNPKTGNYIYFEGDSTGTAEVLLTTGLNYGNPVKFNYALVGKKTIANPYIEFTQINEEDLEIFEPDTFQIKIIEYRTKAKIIIKHINGVGHHIELSGFKAIQE